MGIIRDDARYYCDKCGSSKEEAQVTECYEVIKGVRKMGEMQEDTKRTYWECKKGEDGGGCIDE